VADALASLRDQFRRRRADIRGVFLEDKGIAVVLHYRLAAEDTALAAKSEFLRRRSSPSTAGGGSGDRRRKRSHRGQAGGAK
jgi:trehalose-6-phosphatase